MENVVGVLLQLSYCVLNKFIRFWILYWIIFMFVFVCASNGPLNLNYFFMFRDILKCVN